jgi:hypothetical protein
MALAQWEYPTKLADSLCPKSLPIMVTPRSPEMGLLADISATKISPPIHPLYIPAVRKPIVVNPPQITVPTLVFHLSLTKPKIKAWNIAAIELNEMT